MHIPYFKDAVDVENNVIDTADMSCVSDEESAPLSDEKEEVVYNRPLT